MADVGGVRRTEETFGPRRCGGARRPLRAGLGSRPGQVARRRVNVILTTRLTDNGLCSATSSGTMGKSVAIHGQDLPGKHAQIFCR